MAETPISPYQEGLEMFMRSSGNHQSFFSSRPPPLVIKRLQGELLQERPVSQATDFDTDFDEDDSDTEANSPRVSIESLGKKSDTTISSYEEIPTPRSNHVGGFNFQLDSKPVEGPRGPHLFRTSFDSSNNASFHLTLSPINPLELSARPETAFKALPLQPALAQSIPIHRPITTLEMAVSQLNIAEVRQWSAEQVAAWMYEAGYEEAVVEKFYINDISGAVLIDLKFEDLKELDIQSFGKRHRLWNEIHNLRNSPVPSSPEHTPIDDCESEPEDEQPKKRRGRKHRTKIRTSPDGVLSPLDSVSIVAIEQLLPKLHKCPKGENCSKYRKQLRQRAQFGREFPVSPEGGVVMIAGDPGNPNTAQGMRPTSDVIPSVVASSDILGPGSYPPFQLQEESLRYFQSLRDPQENVKQFLNFQHMQPEMYQNPTEEPSTPPFEMFPPLQLPEQTQPAHQQLRSLPKLDIPLPPRAASAAPFSPERSARAFSPISPPNVYRHGTPFSEMDVPYISVPLGPVARDLTQSVPPDMRYRKDPVPRGASRSSIRRPSLAMAKVDENAVWEPVDGPQDEVAPGPNDVNHAGWMKKRKTKLLRHEWHEHHYRLRGTRLAMHKDELTEDEIDHFDVEDYAVACSSLASNKLSAAFKAMKVSGKKKDADSAAFSFQLIPASTDGKLVKAQGLGKTHHFAVKTRDQRIDWMRELMLAKALKQKGEGYEINVNGNMI
ncbi:MAG: hypothetical protein M1829_003080 [Trizodia sp. TS-e1964]|nr:MAG: hypothetical protein M1829_003080 [Trizodia sp. TS-e1964]